MSGDVLATYQPAMGNDWQLDVDPVDEFVEPTGEAVENTEPATPAVSTAQDDSPPSLARLLEAMLFAAVEPLTFERLAGMIRGLTVTQLDEVVGQLNRQYRQQQRPYHIQQQPLGYRLVLRTRYRPLLETLYGGLKEARFTQAAIECLSIVAYRQPLSLTEIEAIRGDECGQPLKQLIRRGMVQLSGKNEANEPLYQTTQRFLEFFQISKPGDLPRADDLERL
ncbi:MAG: SMC-Scp complex subunit ScpB [Gemmatales bacterium]